MAREELFIGGVYIPLSKSINASLTKSITDIQEPKDRKATYSKTTTVPNSKEAAQVFGELFEINLVDSTFNSTVKIDCRYIVDGIGVIEEGYCQLKAIRTLNRVDIVYDIVMFGSLGNIFKELGEDELIDLSSILDEWNHPFAKDIQQRSWSTEVYNTDSAGFVPFAYGTGYVYPLMDYGFTNDLDNFNFEHMPCALYLKEYIDAIFEYTGKTYTSAFFDSTYFKKHIIPSSPQTYQLDAAEIEARQFKANTPQFTSSGTSTTANLPINSYSSSDTIIFTNEISDPTGLYNNATGEYTITSTTYQGTFDINCLIDITATFTPGTATAVKTTSEIDGWLMVHVNGVQQMAKPFYITSDDATFISGARSTTASPTYEDKDYLAQKYWSDWQSNDDSGRTGDNIPNRYLITLNNVQLNNGDVVEIKWKAGYFGLDTLLTPTTRMFVDSGGTYYSGNATLTMSVGAFYNKVINTFPAEGSTLKIEKIIPKNVKIKDFFMSIVKRYNLWIDIDPNDANNYLIEPRDDFLTDDVIDIQAQRDQNRDLSIIPMGRTDATNYYFHDAPDKDYLNETYTATHQRIYGDRRVNNNNDFVTKVKEIKTIFSPTPLAAPENSNRVLSTIIQKDANGFNLPIDHNIRILYYDGLKDGKAWNHINNVSVFQIPLPTTYTQYPFAGHFDDPYNPSEDINFGLVEEVYYDDNIEDITVTDNNLVNKYYSTMLQQYTSPESKIVKGWFNVTPYDFQNWTFNKLYFFENAYFRLQEISNYNPTGEALTECTFLFLPNVPRFSSSPIQVFGEDSASTPSGTGGGTIDLDENVPTKGTKTAQNQDGNNTANRNVDIQGSYNYVAYDAYNIEIQGEGNKVWSEAEDIKIQGDNNIIDGGVKNVTLINTDGLTISKSDVTYINGVKVNPAAISSPTDVEQISASQDVETDVKTYEVDTSGGDVTLTFQLAFITYTEGQVWNFKKMEKNNDLIISVNGGTIDDQASQTIKKRYTSLSVQYNGTNFIII